MVKVKMSGQLVVQPPVAVTPRVKSPDLVFVISRLPFPRHFSVLEMVMDDVLGRGHHLPLELHHGREISSESGDSCRIENQRAWIVDWVVETERPRSPGGLAYRRAYYLYLIWEQEVVPNHFVLSLELDERGLMHLLALVYLEWLWLLADVLGPQAPHVLLAFLWLILVYVWVDPQAQYYQSHSSERELLSLLG